MMASPTSRLKDWMPAYDSAPPLEMVLLGRRLRLNHPIRVIPALVFKDIDIFTIF